ncbi:MAG: methyltransferase domain-containing protein [Pirellulaceae bacterium]
MPAANLEDFAWLVGPEAAVLLAERQGDARSLVTQTTALRQQLGSTRTHLLLEQVGLQARAKAKFSRADRMYFTPKLLEQATDEPIADYKAQRFGRNTRIADLCCGMGGDLLAFAERGATVGADRDPVAIQLARANCRALGLPDVDLRTADVEDFPVADFDAWHIDPDRRSQGRRTSRFEFGSPGPDALTRLLADNPHGAVKLAPAAGGPSEWSDTAEREWVGSRRECRQQILWLADLAGAPGRRTATVVDRNHDAVSFRGEPEVVPDPACSVDRYLFEPHAVVIAASLTGALAVEMGLRPIYHDCAYLTGSAPPSTPLLAAFEVWDVLPFDVKRLKSVLRSRRVGQLEVKVRGVRVEPNRVRRRLRVPGDQVATLLLAGTKEATTAILARRCGA